MSGAAGAELISVLLPLIQSFLKGKSGDELSTLLGNNPDALRGLLGGGAGGASPTVIPYPPDKSLEILSMMMPLLKQPPLVIIPKDNSIGIADIPPSQAATAAKDEEIAALHAKLKAGEERLIALEKFVNINKDKKI